MTEIDILRRQLEAAYRDCAAMRLALDTVTRHGTEALLTAEDVLEARRGTYSANELVEKQARGRVIMAAIARRKADAIYVKMRASPIEYFSDIQQAAQDWLDSKQAEDEAIDELLRIRS